MTTDLLNTLADQVISGADVDTCLDFLMDGEALSNAGFNDQSEVDAAYNLLWSMKHHGAFFCDTGMVEENIRRNKYSTSDLAYIARKATNKLAMNLREVERKRMAEGVAPYS